MKPSLFLAALLATIVLAAAWALPAGPPFLPPGEPWAREVVSATTTAVVTISATTCRPDGTSTGIETPALVQVLSNSIYYTIHTTTGTPVATDYNAAANDWFWVPRPSKFRALGNSGTASLVVTCFVK